MKLIKTTRVGQEPYCTYTFVFDIRGTQYTIAEVSQHDYIVFQKLKDFGTGFKAFNYLKDRYVVDTGHDDIDTTDVDGLIADFFRTHSFEESTHGYFFQLKNRDTGEKIKIEIQATSMRDALVQAIYKMADYERRWPGLLSRSQGGRYLVDGHIERAAQRLQRGWSKPSEALDWVNIDMSGLRSAFELSCPYPSIDERL